MMSMFQKMQHYERISSNKVILEGFSNQITCSGASLVSVESAGVEILQNLQHAAPCHSPPAAGLAQRAHPAGPKLAVY